jgi:CRISPR/Cas system-associated exonuclease Cas4 (RecB family)
MVGPSTLSTAMGCPRRFRTLIESLQGNPEPTGQDERGGNEDHKREGMLLESILQFIAVGRDVPEERNISSIQERYDIVYEILVDLKQPNVTFSAKHAEALLMKSDNARALTNYSVEDLVSKMEESITQFLFYIEENGLDNCKWKSEVHVEGVLTTPFGEVEAGGRIDLLCFKENNHLIIEIKKRERFEESDTIQAQFYAQLLDEEDCEISVINGGYCQPPTLALPVKYDFNQNEGDVTRANQKNCQHCPDLTCLDSFIGH